MLTLIHKYGKLGDVRRQAHGGFEYRTLPSWIISPRITKGVLAMAKLIACHYRELRGRPLDQVKYMNAYKAGNKLIMKPLVESLWSQLEQTDGYAEYDHYLEPLRNWVMEQKNWNEQRDFRMAWKVPPFC